MEKLYYETNNLLQKVQIDLGRLEGCQNEQDAQVIVQYIYTDLKGLEENGRVLDDFVSREAPARRQMARMKIDQLKSDIQRVSLAVATVHTKMTNKWRAASDRDELLTQRFRPNDTTLSMGDHELLMNDRLQSSHTHLDNLIEQATSAYDSIRAQGMNLRGVRRKMLDVGQALGLSNSTLQVIDRRVREDWFIFLIGCFVCIVFMYCFYRFWKG